MSWLWGGGRGKEPAEKVGETLGRSLRVVGTHSCAPWQEPETHTPLLVTADCPSPGGGEGFCPVFPFLSPAESSFPSRLLGASCRHGSCWC